MLPPRDVLAGPQGHAPSSRAEALRFFVRSQPQKPPKGRVVRQALTHGEGKQEIDTFSPGVLEITYSLGLLLMLTRMHNEPRVYVA